MKKLLEQYLKNLTDTFKRGDAREESYYKHLDELLKLFAESQKVKNIDVTILPKKTEAGNPDFRIWDGKNHITGYIEAKDPSITNLDYVEETEQLKRYLSTFPNVVLTNFYEFRLYRKGELIAKTTIARPAVAKRLQTTPPVENVDEFKTLFELFFSFSAPKIQTARSLAVELAKRTRFLRDEVIVVEIEENGGKGHKQIVGFFEAFKKYLIGTLSEKQFADLYAQTITYGLFAARSRADGEFNRKLAFDYIPHTIGILRDLFRFISLEEPPKSLQIIVDDIAEILNVADANKILREYQRAGKGKDPIIHFYETFLTTYDPKVRERRGVYYTPEAIVGYITRAVHSILKTRFDFPDGLASENVKLLDPAGGTLTFPAEAIRLAADEFKNKYGEGGLNRWIKKHILKDFYAFELMMAPYAIGHLKIGFIFDELGYKMSDDERFKLYLTNSLEMEEIKQIAIPGLSSLSEESHLAGEIKNEQPVLVILGNPPYSGNSANINEWTEKLLKEDIINGINIQSYYKINGQPLGERNPKLLQDDYVKFIRFAQWKISKSGFGIVGMITNHGFLDNPTFRGMRQSLMETFDEIYIIDLHGNSLKKETTPEGEKDENVFDIRQGVSVSLFIKNKKTKRQKIFHKDLFGLREEKYRWLESNAFSKSAFKELKPETPWYFFIPRHTKLIKHYLKWKSVNEIFPINSTGVKTHRDHFVIDFDENTLKNKIRQFKNLSLPNDLIRKTFDLKDNRDWKLSEARQKLAADKDWEQYIKNIQYRPFDKRKIFYYEYLIDWPRRDVMHNLFNENLSLCFMRQYSGNLPYSHFLISDVMVDNRTFFSSKGTIQQAPLYIYPDDEKNSRKHSSTIMMVFEPAVTYGKRANIASVVFEELTKAFGKTPTPEDILYYIYGVFYSDTFRETYAEFLKIDFPRVPFTSNLKLFEKIVKYGKELSDLHLLKSSALDSPIAKYKGTSNNDKIEKIVYNEKEKKIYINKEKYFDNVKPEIWNYHIGGYQVLQKYLKDRKGRNMEDAPLYCRIVTALSKTIKIQSKIDAIYPEVEKELIRF